MSPLGKAFASVTALSGILIIAMPVAVIGSNFVDFYSNQNKKKFILRINKFIENEVNDATKKNSA